MPRRLSDKDAADWARVADSIKPLDPQTRARARRDAAKLVKPDKSVEPAAPATDPKPRKVKPAGPILQPPPRAIVATAKPSLPRLDQSAARRLKRVGTPDARIDLHGMKQTEAHHRLLGFLRAAHGSGHKVVLVITGKGRSGSAETDWWAEGDRGVLRQAVPSWLATAPFRSVVAGFQTAGREHGGSGALYVQLRGRRRTGEDIS